MESNDHPRHGCGPPSLLWPEMAGIADSEPETQTRFLAGIQESGGVNAALGIALMLD